MSGSISRLVIAMSAVIVFNPAAIKGAIIADHNSCAAFDALDDSQAYQIRDNYKVYYVHTSHGGQVMTGLNMVETEDATWDYPPIQEVSDDLGHLGDTSWAAPCRAFLDANPDYNMVMFSWCGGCSDNTEEGINIYLNKMSELEAQYPDRAFVYMTGHLDGTGVGGNLYARNDQIRQYCLDNNKILFDFADIESYDPDGVYYPDASDACEWCYDWCALYSCPSCGGCAHSHCFNCYQKGKAWWSMMYEIHFESQECFATGDCNDDGIPLGGADLVYLSNFVNLGGPPLAVPSEGDLNGDGYLDALDVQKYLDYFESGLGVFDEYPVPTICSPDTFRYACCGASPDSCLVLAPANCHEAEGGLLGSPTCAGLDCDTVAIGACCDSAMGCYVRSRWECENFGNIFVGDGTDCSPYPCFYACCDLRGDANHDGVGPDISDLVYVVSYMFAGGPLPPCAGESDINGDWTGPDISDLVHLVSYMFSGGPPPAECP